MRFDQIKKLPHLQLVCNFFLVVSIGWLIILLFVFQPYFFNDENYMHGIAIKNGAWESYLDLCRYKPRLISNACILIFLQNLRWKPNIFCLIINFIPSNLLCSYFHRLIKMAETQYSILFLTGNRYYISTLQYL